MIPFNKPYLTGKETHYIYEAVYSGKLSGNGKFTQLCQQYFENRYSFLKCLLTTSCTDALEMAALLLNIQPKDEVIMPSYTFVSTANAFVLRGANIKFVDCEEKRPNISIAQIEKAINVNTKAIVVVHYAGIACDMDAVMDLSKKYKIPVIEDAAQSINTFYKGKALGGIGHLSTFSFHGSKNIHCGEGGMLVVNEPELVERSEIIWEKGTNRAAFARGEVKKYSWVDLGSSFLPSEISAAFLYAQFEQLDNIENKRKQLWNYYYEKLETLSQKGYFELPYIPDYSNNNAHIFYIILPDIDKRNELLKFLEKNKVEAVFHYIPLHSSPFYKKQYKGSKLPNCQKFADRLLRLPLFYDLKYQELDYIIKRIEFFFK